jgi:hypothetical protein
MFFFVNKRKMSRVGRIYDNPDIANKRRRMLQMAVPTGTMPNLLPTQEDFDIAVEVGNVPLVEYWKDKYGFQMDEVSAIRSNNPEMLDLIESWYDYSDFDPVLEEVAKVGNMYFLDKFANNITGIPPEFAKFGWIEGILYLLKVHPPPYDADLILPAIVEAINNKHEDVVELLLSKLTHEQMRMFRQDILVKNWDIDYDDPEVIDMFDRLGIQSKHEYQYRKITSMIIREINDGNWQQVRDLMTELNDADLTKVMHDIGMRDWLIDYDRPELEQIFYDFGIKF